MGLMIKNRKLSPSGSMATIVEKEDGTRSAAITDAMGHTCTLSSSGVLLLQVTIYFEIVSFEFEVTSSKII